MEHKFVEIRDVGTFIAALAIQISEADGYLAKRAGFGARPCIYLIALSTQRCAYDPYDWKGHTRTMPVAHKWLVEHFDTVTDGGVVDVAYILGESPAPKRSEFYTAPL